MKKTFLLALIPLALFVLVACAAPSMPPSPLTPVPTPTKVNSGSLFRSNLILLIDEGIVQPSSDECSEKEIFSAAYIYRQVKNMFIQYNVLFTISAVKRIDLGDLVGSCSTQEAAERYTKILAQRQKSQDRGSGVYLHLPDGRAYAVYIQ